MYKMYLPLFFWGHFIEFHELSYFFRINIFLQFPGRIFILQRSPFDQVVSNRFSASWICVSRFIQDSINFDKVWIERIIFGLERKGFRKLKVLYHFYCKFLISSYQLYQQVKIINIKYIFKDICVLLLLLLESLQLSLNSLVSFI